MSDKPKGLFSARPAANPEKPTGLAGRKDVRKRWMLVIGGLVGFAVLASTMFSDKADKVAPGPKSGSKESFIDVTPKGAQERSWQAKSQKDILGLKDENKKLQETLATLARDQAEAAARPPAGVVAPPSEAGGFALGALPVIPPPIPKFVQPPTPGASAPVPAEARSPAGLAGSAGAALPAYAPPQPASGQNLFEPPSAEPEAAAALPGKGASTAAAGTPGQPKTTYQQNKYSGFLPAGAFARVVLLNGLEAGTSSTAQSNPQPVLIAVSDHAVLPGAARYNIKSCFVLGSGYGDSSSERVYLRLAQMSCVDKADRLVLTTPVSGYVVDSDGKVGLRGVVIDRQGAKLHKALLAGFAQGLAGALGAAQSTTTASAALGTITTLAGGGDALKASGLSGAQSAANQLATFYLKEAQSIFPVISVDTGRTGTIVFTEGTGLVWGQGDSLYVKDTKPQ